MDSEVAVVGLGVHAMKFVFIKQFGDHRGKPLGCKSAALTIGRERDAYLGGGRLIGHDAYSAVAKQGPTESVDHGQLHPCSRRPQLDTLLRGENRPASAIEKVASHD